LLLAGAVVMDGSSQMSGTIRHGSDTRRNENSP